MSLNPCCSGRWSRTTIHARSLLDPKLVIILVVVDNGLVLELCKTENHRRIVLILVVVDNGLVLLNKLVMTLSYVRLNPCCNGQWSRTFGVKTKQKS